MDANLSSQGIITSHGTDGGPISAEEQNGQQERQNINAMPSGASSLHSAPTRQLSTNLAATAPPGLHSLPQRPPISTPTQKPRPNQPSSSSNNGNGTSREPIVVPSAASGGVPDPTPAYLAQAALPPVHLPTPKYLLLVLDLNGTLLHRPNPRQPRRFVPRPHAQPFLRYCLRTFAVLIWSSARADNVRALIAQLLTPAEVPQLAGVWARDRFGLTPADFAQRVMCYKRLGAVWADGALAARHPLAAAGECWHQGNTVLVDDSVEKARAQPHNLVCIPEFVSGNSGEDHLLPHVHDYINELAHQGDVSAYIRVNPFRPGLVTGLPPAVDEMNV